METEQKKTSIFKSAWFWLVVVGVIVTLAAGVLLLWNNFNQTILIIGLALGILLIIGGLIWFFVKRNKKKKEEEMMKNQEVQESFIRQRELEEQRVAQLQNPEIGLASRGY